MKTASATAALCSTCEIDYDPQRGFPRLGIAPGTAWQDIPACFRCALCDISNNERSLMYYGT